MNTRAIVNLPQSLLDPRSNAARQVLYETRRDARLDTPADVQALARRVARGLALQQALQAASRSP
jgi:hypothetical protein